MAGRRNRWVVSLLLTVVAFFVLAAFVRIDLSKVWVTAQKVGVSGVAAAFGLYLAANVIRAARVWLLLGGAYSFGDLVAVSFLHLFYGTFLPFKIGEFSFLFLMKRQGLRMAKGLPILMVARIGDVLALAMIFFGVLPFAGALPPVVSAAPWAVLIGVAMLGAVVVAALVFHRVILRRLQHFLDGTRWQGFSRLRLALHDLEEVLQSIHARKFVVVLILSGLIWCVNLGVTYMLVEFAGFDLTVGQVVLIGCLASFISLVPLHGVAGLGTMDATRVVLFSIFGVAAAEALGFSLFKQFMTLAFAAVMGLVAWLLPPRRRE